MDSFQSICTTENCIHLANVFYLGSFLMRDMLWLRVLTCAGMSLGVIFFVTCPTPMYGPAGWHVVFLVINAYQIVRLIQSRQQTDLKGHHARVADAATVDMTREELVTALTHGLSGRVDPDDTLTATAKQQLDPDELVIRHLVLDHLSRRELVNLLSRRLWRPVSKRFRRKSRARHQRRRRDRDTAIASTNTESFTPNDISPDVG